MIDYIFAIIFLSIMTIGLGTYVLLLIKSNKHWQTEYRNMRDKYYDIKIDLDGCKRENAEMKNKIELDWPVISNPILEPAISGQCRNCKYAVKSGWDNNVLKCCKNSVCIDFHSIPDLSTNDGKLWNSIPDLSMNDGILWNSMPDVLCK